MFEETLAAVDDYWREQFEAVDKYWGERMPMMAMEEAGEFIQAISKVERGKDGSIEHLAEEIGDLIIAIEAIRHHYAIDPDMIVEKLAEKLRKEY